MSSESLPPKYESLSAREKQSILWSRINQEPYPEGDLPTSGPGGFSTLHLLRPSYLAKSFTLEGDEMSPDRQKLIHAFGSVGKVELKIFENSKYTGLFEPSSAGKLGIVRLSLATQDYKNFTPGMALKFLVDGQPSLNMVSMFSVNGQGENKNFFENSFKNVIPDAEGLVLKALTHQFRESLKELPGDSSDKPLHENNMPLFTPSSMNSEGIITGSPKYPAVIKFLPNAGLGWNKDDTADFRVHLARIPVDTMLYTVAAQATPDADEEVIGQLVLTSNLVTSAYGDQHLFFRHHPKSSMN